MFYSRLKGKRLTKVLPHSSKGKKMQLRDRILHLVEDLISDRLFGHVRSVRDRVTEI